MKKILFLAIFCILLTGCTVNYNLVISDNYFSEDISGNVLNSEFESDKDQTDINMYNYLLNAEQSVYHNNSNSFYNKTLNRKDNSIDYNYSFDYNEYNFNDSRILNECFENFNFSTEDNNYYLSVSGDFYCDYTDKININITTDYRVVINNASKVKNNTYTWTIDNNNKDDFELYMTISKVNGSNKSNWNTFKTIGLIILVLLSGLCIFLIRKKEQY